MMRSNHDNDNLMNDESESVIFILFLHLLLMQPGPSLILHICQHMQNAIIVRETLLVFC